MRQIKFIILCFVVLEIYSCDLCGRVNCAGSNFYGQFRIVDKANGSDLVFGTTATYNKNQIMFFSLSGADTVNYEYSTIKFGGNGYDSILYVRFYPLPGDLVFMKLSATDIDTLNLSYNTTSSKCCGTTTSITKFRYNNSVELPGDKGTQEIKK